MRDERRKEERSKQDQINNKAKQHSTHKAVNFPKKNELPRVGLEPTTLYTLDRALYHLSYQGSSNKASTMYTHVVESVTCFLLTCIVLTTMPESIYIHVYTIHVFK